nr:integrase, catalytic region, zinc finger, CCHC-type, peptidase aspartic, catalytic [Tanacetum cinerariifolium]
MELAVEQHCAEKTKFQTKMENVLQENDRLLTQALSVEIVNIVVHDNVKFDCLNRDTVSSPESALTFTELFEINDLKAQVQEKDTVILKLREKLNSLSGNVKVDVAPLVPKLRENMTAHTDYIRHTQEEAATLREIVESERLFSPLNTSLAYVCKYTRRIQELMMILQQSCPSITNLETKLVAVTPKNKTKQIRRTAQNTKSEKTTVATSPSVNIASNTPVLSSTGVTLVSSASGSKSQDNTKKNRIRRTQKKSKKTELEDQLRTVKSSLNKASVVDSKATSSVIKSVSNLNSNLKCASCAGCLFSDNHDACVVAYINSVNASKKSKSVKTSIKRKVVQIVLWYLDSGCSKHMTGDRSQLISFVQKFLGTVNFGNDHVTKIMGYGDYQIGNVIISRVYYVERLGHNLFSVGQFCDSDLEVAFRQHTCFIHNGTEFVNQMLRDYYEEVGISHETSVARSPQQNGVVERRNRTLIEAAHTMLIYAQAPLFLWAEVVATACFTQNRSIIRLRHGKTPYELLHSKLPDLSFFHVFGALYYPTNDSENLGKLQPKADIGIFIGYAPSKKAFRIHNRRTRRIVETIHVDFDELTAMASEQLSSGPALNEMTPGTISSRLEKKISPSASYVPPSRNDWDLLFQLMFDELLNPPPIDQDAPSPSKSLTPTEIQSSVILQDVGNDNFDIEVAHMGNDLLLGVPIPEVTSEQSQSSSTASPQSNVQPNHPMTHHNSKWTKDHPLNNIIGQLSRPVSTRLQLHEQALFCYYDAFLTSVEPKTYKDALTQACWIKAMQEELNEFERLEVWELVPRPDKVMVITLKV